MEEYHNAKKHMYVKMALLYTVLLIGAFLLFDVKAVFGLSYGAIVCLLNFYLITYRVERLDRFSDKKKAVAYMLLGTVIRFIIIVVALWFAVRDPRLNFGTVALGLLIFQLVIFIEIILALGRKGLKKLQIPFVVKQGGGE